MTTKFLKWALFVPGLLLSTNLFGTAGECRAAGLSGAVVKISSKKCTGQTAGIFNGSGLAFRRDGHVYVLTSEHVLIHQGSGICINVAKAGWHAEANAVRIDWAFGLGLLQLATVPAAATGLPDWSELALDHASAFAPTVTAGFPASSQSLFLDHATEIVSLDSRRHLFPADDVVTEISGHGEFGMSGGAVLSQDEGTYLGTLSHQYLQMVPGGSSVVREFGENSTQVQNTLIIIPGDVGRNFIDEALGGSMPDPFFLRDPDAQVRGRDVVMTQGLRFEFIAGTPEGHVPGDGGIGGIDPVGIGGADQPQDLYSKVRVSAVHNPAATRWMIPAQAPWINRMKTRLVGRDAVDVQFLVMNNRRVPFGSLAKFFIAMTQGARPAVALDPASDDISPKVRQLMNDGRLVEAKAAVFAAREQTEAVASFLAHATSLAKLLQTGEWALVDHGDLQTVFNDHAAGDQLFAQSFDDAVAFFQGLNDASHVLASLGN